MDHQMIIKNAILWPKMSHRLPTLEEEDTFQRIGRGLKDILGVTPGVEILGRCHSHFKKGANKWCDC